MTIELYINGTLTRLWLYDDMPAGYGKLHHEAREQYIQDKINDLKQLDNVYSLLYIAQHYEFCVLIKSRPAPDIE